MLVSGHGDPKPGAGSAVVLGSLGLRNSSSVLHAEPERLGAVVLSRFKTHT